MSPRHDLECPGCARQFPDMPAFCAGTGCGHCGAALEIAWQARPRNARPLAAAETTVVYQHPESGHVVYPGRNDQPMPARYARRGYERKELTSLSAVDRFSKEHRLVNERAHYDRGSGRGYDT